MKGNNTSVQDLPFLGSSISYCLIVYGNTLRAGKKPCPRGKKEKLTKYSNNDNKSKNNNNKKQKTTTTTKNNNNNSG